MSRTLIEILNKYDLYSENIVATNMEGGDGARGWGFVYNQKGNPYHISSTSGSFMTTPLAADTPWGPTSFTPIGMLATDDTLFVVRADAPYDTMEEFVAAAKEKSLPVGGIATINIDFIMAELVSQQTGFELKYVPFNDEGEMISALLSKSLVMIASNPAEVIGIVESGDAKALAFSGKQPMRSLPDVPTFEIGLILLTVLAPAFSRLARSFGPSETFLVVMIGLLTLIVIAGGKWRYGVISALFGFTLATVGVDLGTGDQRYTFGSPELITGINFIPVAIGLFGIGELLYTLHQGEHTEEDGFTRVSGRGPELWPKREDWSESGGSMARGSLLGFLVGTTPGAGATVASLMSYSLEKTVSKTPEKFGKGALAGLVGPESANNAASTGAMVPLLTLGIPGSAATAVLLGAFLLWGLQPGPLLMTQNPDFAWGLIGSMYLGNVMLVVLNVFAIPLFAHIARIPARIMVPIVIVLCTIGTFSVNGSIVETWIMLGCGVIGFFMKLYGYSPAATVIALVLGPLAEETLRQSLIISGGGLSIFYTRSVSLVLLIIFGLLIASPLALSLYRRRSTHDDR